MCGLAGVASRYITEKHKVIFKELMIAAMLRGTHSAGVASIFTDWEKGKRGPPDFSIAKTVGTPLDLFDRRSFDTVMRQTSVRALIGHCRSATVGSISMHNAHPFVTDHLLGAHNGTIRTVQKNQTFFGTDSECLYDNIDTDGLKATLERTVGAWALTWFDFRDGTLNLLRNSQRTLYMAQQTTDEDLYWASEEGALRWILDRNGIRDYELVLLRQDLHLKFKLFEDSWQKTFTTEEIVGKEETKPVEQRTIPFQNGYTQHYHAHEEATPKAQENSTSQSSNSTVTEAGHHQVNEEKTSTNSQTNNGQNTSITPDVTLLTVKGFDGMMISKGKLREILEEGCAWCGVVQSSKLPYRFVDKDHYLCEECKDQPGLVDFTKECLAQYGTVPTGADVPVN